MEAPRVLVVDDEFFVVELLSTLLGSFGMQMCASAPTADGAVVMARMHLPELILMDVRLKGRKDGIEAATEIRETLDVPIIFITGSSDRSTLERIQRIHQAVVLIKPFRPDQLQTAITHVMA